MDDYASYYYWIRFGIVVLVALVAVIAALRRSRDVAARRDSAFALIGVAALIVVVVLVGGPIDYVMTGVLLVAGVALGFLAGAVRPLIAWMWTLSAIFAAIMVLFGEPLAAAFGVAVYGFGAGLPVGQAIRGMVRERGAAEPTQGTPPSEPQPS